MTAYQALHQGYSPIYNDRIVRVSMCNERSQEFFTIITAGKDYRKRLDKALDMLQDAIDDGHAPGEVRMQ
jgi:predicted transcriptional regulator